MKVDTRIRREPRRWVQRVAASASAIVVFTITVAGALSARSVGEDANGGLRPVAQLAPGELAPTGSEPLETPAGADGRRVHAPPPPDLDEASQVQILEQFALESETGRVPVDSFDVAPQAWVDLSAYSATAAQRRQLALPAYASATSDTVVGMLTDAGVVDLATFGDPSFDVETVMLERFGPERVATYRANGRHW